MKVTLIPNWDVYRVAHALVLGRTSRCLLSQDGVQEHPQGMVWTHVDAAVAVCYYSKPEGVEHALGL